MPVEVDAPVFVGQVHDGIDRTGQAAQNGQADGRGQPALVSNPRRIGQFQTVGHGRHDQRARVGEPEPGQPDGHQVPRAEKGSGKPVDHEFLGIERFRENQAAFRHDPGETDINRQHQDQQNGRQPGGETDHPQPSEQE